MNKKNKTSKKSTVFMKQMRTIFSKEKLIRNTNLAPRFFVLMSHRKNLILNCEALANNPFDGHALEQALQEAENLSCLKIERALMDKGYRGRGIKNRKILISGRGKLSISRSCYVVVKL